MYDLRRFLVPIILVASCQTASAQSGPDDWKTECDASFCAISRGLMDQQKRLVATFLASVRKDTEQTTLAVAVALGAALRPGVRLIAGDQTYELGFEVCFPDGCRAVRQFEPAELEQIAEAESVEIRFFPYSSDKPVAITMPFAGFAEATADARKTLNAN